MRKIPVRLGDRSYDISVGPLAAGVDAAFRTRLSGARRALLVTSASVSRAGIPAKVAAVLKRRRVLAATAVVADGEAVKTLATVHRLYGEAVRAGLDRRSVIVAVGGGVVTDMAGFLAATYMRGLDFLSVPTSLLAMVDAAIGGKTGVDLPEGKNLIGAFWQPRAVINDPSVLKTLPEREWITGFGEVVKYGVIRNAPFFRWLEERIAARPDPRRWTPKDVERVLVESAKAKAAVVSGDEREAPLRGGREILNFGHTAGHALEAATGYHALSHGEAISIGMMVAGRIALLLGLWNAKDHDRLSRLLSAFRLPVRFPKLDGAGMAAFWSALAKDKKNVNGALRFVLPDRLGKVEVRSGIPVEIVEQAVALEAGGRAF
jgi:3-dehydroquinate synthase